MSATFNKIPTVATDSGEELLISQTKLDNIVEPLNNRIIDIENKLSLIFDDPDHVLYMVQK